MVICLGTSPRSLLWLSFSRFSLLAALLSQKQEPQHEVLRLPVLLAYPQSTEPFHERLFLRRFHFIKGNAHPHVALRIDNTAGDAKGLLVVEDLDLHGGAERQWIQHVQIAAISAQLTRASGQTRLRFLFDDLGRGVKRIAGAPANL